MRAFTTIGFGFLVLMAATATAQDSKLVEPKANAYEGNYTIESGEEDGKPVPDEHVKGSTVRITGDAIVVADKDDKEIYVTKYVLNADKDPAKITMTETGGPRGRKGQKAIGLIGKDGDSVKLCYCYEGGIVPTGFKTKAGEKQLCFVLKKKEAK